MKSSKLCTALENRINNYLEQARKVQTDASPDAIHDFRVASRYLLAIEPLLRGVSDTSKWRKKAKSWLKSLTHLRDLHVFMERFNADPVIQTLLDTEINKELAHWEKIRLKVADDGYVNKLQTSHYRLCSVQHKKTTIDALVYELWLRRCTVLGKKLHTIDYTSPKSIHRLRIAFKSVRYLASFLHESDLVPFSSFDGFRYWQDIMGDINDLKVVADWLGEKPGVENQASQLNAEAALLRQKFSAEEPALRAFIESINEDVLSGLGVRARSCT